MLGWFTCYSSRLVGINLTKLKEGFVYSVKARIQPVGSTSHCNDETFASAWSETLAVPTALCKSLIGLLPPARKLR